ncbi:uncharacterized protein PHALS_12183 [Plasmopara halstedii]|uniref:Bzip transcription factor n=1 Tax=Plasmopara halstedii TaxID=4781 RepID=A0A0P1ALK5_PLAHL|nr:uncharacterized protein PHALS_12183 [Plasmopara halstedii]CEG41868.1 hypothetical protein PHALS_12183 [Plasmopara halstedii]|eukprot:XP_024578237.1 hypothetical protein PHALS_12183 [Plasmopara halstedii]
MQFAKPLSSKSQWCLHLSSIKRAALEHMKLSHLVGAHTKEDDRQPKSFMSQNALSYANSMIKALDSAGTGDEFSEKVQRRRLQYKLHQRHHRAKQKEKLAQLEFEVQHLTAEVDILHHERQSFLIQNNCFESRGTIGGRPAHVAMEYFRLFQASAFSTHLDMQEQFLRSVMTSDTRGPDYVGVDTIVTQWRGFCSFFAYLRYKPLTITITTVGELTVIEVDSIFSIGAQRDGIIALYPSLNGNTELLQKLSGNVINVRVKYYFTFDSTGTVTWFSAEWDLVNALQQLLDDLDDVNTVLSGANISTSTGQLSVENIHAIESKRAIDPRLDVKYLLS